MIILIEQKLEEIKLSSAQQTVAQYLLEKRSAIEYMTIHELAKQTYTSTATIIRLAKKLGYNGYQELKDDFLQEVHYLDTHFNNINPNYPFDPTDNIQKIAGKVSMLEKETIEDTLTLINHDSLQNAVWTMKKSRHIHLCAISYCLLLGQMFKLDMMRIGVSVNICDLSGDELFLPALVDKKDCVIFISYSGQIDKLCLLAKQVKKQGAKVIVISALGNNELKKYADCVLNISTREKLLSKVKGYANEVSIKLILDILYSCFFATEYQRNNEKRIEISQFAETSVYSTKRDSTLGVMKEE